METFFFAVGFTDRRPVVADEHTTYVVIATDAGLTDARLAALQMVACRAEMVTSARLLLVEV